MAQFIPADPFDLVMFGGTGDLAKRKLLPALFRRDRDGQLGEGSRIIASSRKPLDRDGFLRQVEEALHRHVPKSVLDEETWHRFSARLEYHRQDVAAREGWQDLAAVLGERRAHPGVLPGHAAGAVRAGLREPVPGRVGGRGRAHRA